MPDCSKDNLVTFTADAGAVKCSTHEDQTWTGTWKMDAYPAFILKEDGSMEQTDGTITLINEQSLKYYEPSDNGQYSYTTVLKRK